jgi:hypothetical protein
MSVLQQPPAPTWWEQQWFNLVRREHELAAEEAWLEEERTRYFPLRCRERAQTCQEQEAKLLQQMQHQSKQGSRATIAWVLTGIGRPVLSRAEQAAHFARALDAVRSEFQRREAQDRQWLERRSRELELKRAQLQADRQAFADLMQQYNVTLP